MHYILTENTETKMQKLTRYLASSATSGKLEPAIISIIDTVHHHSDPYIHPSVCVIKEDTASTVGIQRQFALTEK